MKIQPFLLLSFYFFIFIFIIDTTVQANSNKEESSLINTFYGDITGDGLREDFILRGTLLSKKSNYFRDLSLHISSPLAKQWTISLNGGYNPSIQLIDLNQDQIVDVFYQVAKNENNEQFDYQIYTLNGNVIEQLPLPRHKYIKGSFLNNYRANIQINPNSKPFIINLSKKKRKYINEDIYDEDGSLIIERKAIIDQITYLEPILISESKGYGLKSYQTIKGIDSDDVLGEVKTLWYYNNNEWIILKTEFIS